MRLSSRSSDTACDRVGCSRYDSGFSLQTYGFEKPPQSQAESKPGLADLRSLSQVSNQATLQREGCSRYDLGCGVRTYGFEKPTRATKNRVTRAWLDPPTSIIMCARRPARLAPLYVRVMVNWVCRFRVSFQLHATAKLTPEPNLLLIVVVFFWGGGGGGWAS